MYGKEPQSFGTSLCRGSSVILFPVEKMCKKKKEIKKLNKEMKRKNVTQKSQTLSLPDYQQIFA